MYKIIDFLFLLLAALQFVWGFFQSREYFTYYGSLNNECNALGFAYIISALFLVASLWFVDKKYPSILNLFIAFTISFVVLYLTSNSLQAFYGINIQCPGFGPY